jgi:Icc protein
MSDNKQGTGIDRRGALECMIWAGTGVIWTLSGGVPKSSQLLGIGAAQATEKAVTGFSFLQISDSHVGFSKPANPDALGTLKEAIDKVNGLPVKPAFMIHTGDITHLSKPGQFDDAERVIGEAKLDVHYVPGEHDIIDENNGQAYLERYGKNTKGTGWFAFDQGGVHFIGLVNVANLKAGGMGSLGDEQLAWLAHDLKGKPVSTPIVVFAHIPLWAVYPEWGWGTDDSANALLCSNGSARSPCSTAISISWMQKVEGNVTFHTAMSTAFPQPAPGTAASPGPMLVPAEKLRTLLGITSVEVRRGRQRLAITDTPLTAS